MIANAKKCFILIYGKNVCKHWSTAIIINPSLIGEILLFLKLLNCVAPVIYKINSWYFYIKFYTEHCGIIVYLNVDFIFRTSVLNPENKC